MKPKALGLVLPAALVVTTFSLAASCQHTQEYCVDIDKKSVCDSAEGCAWNDAEGLCENVCDEITDQAACEDIKRCEWSPPIEGDTDTSGNEATCHEPFT